MGKSKAENETEKIRAEAKMLFREIEAICLLTKSINVEEKAYLSNVKTRLDTWDRAPLHKFVHQAKREIQERRTYYGIKASGSELIEILDWVERDNGDRLTLLPKHILREIFDRYELVSPDFSDLAEHADIVIHFGTNAEPGKTAFFLLEAILYEDMASMFNLMKEHQHPDSKTPSRKAHKSLSALCRGSLSAAFYLVESYLNGIAFDHFIIHESILDQETKGYLLEWDYSRNQAKYLILREKVLKYPRIILGVRHAPLDETNCKELAIFLDKSKTLRDAIVHAAPRLKSSTLAADKRQTIYQIGPEDAERTVDNAIRLIKRIETKVRGNTQRLSWLHDRASNGFFPDVAFE